MYSKISGTAARIAETMVRLTHVLTRRLAEDRGDVPGWVLVTVMTAGLVTGIWIVADEQLTSMLSRAINAVSK